MQIYLCGIYHIFQTRKDSDFLDYLRNTCSTYNVKSIAEEMNVDALRLAEVEKSTILEIAEEFRIPHAYCDPDENERKINDIIGQSELKLDQVLRGLSDEEAANIRSQHYGKRERIWLEKNQTFLCRSHAFYMWHRPPGFF